MPEAPSLLIVGDDAFVREYLKDAIAEVPLRIREARNGAEALARVAEESPAVVLLDLMMPEMSGLQVLRALQEQSPNSRVVVISSMDSELLIAEALANGAFNFIGKPFHPLEVAEAVRGALGA